MSSLAPASRHVVLLGLLALGLLAWWWANGRSGDAPGPDPAAARTEHAQGEGPTLAVSPRPPQAAPAPAPDINTPAAPAVTAPCVIEFVVRDVATRAPRSGALLKARWTTSVVVGDSRAGIVNVRDEPIWVEVLLDADGVGRAEAPRKLTYAPSTLDLGAEWHVLRMNAEGTEGPGGQHAIALTPGAVTRVEVWVRRAYDLAGEVTGPDGAPLPGARVELTVIEQLPGGGFNMGSRTVRTDAAGRFRCGPCAEDPRAGMEKAPDWVLGRLDQLLVALDGYATLRLVPSSIPPAERESLRLRLTRGVTLAGTLVDVRGRPLEDVPVVVEYGQTYELRRGVRTDSDGRWRLERLSTGAARLAARAFRHDAKVARDLVLEQDDLDVRLVAQDIRLSRPPTTTQVLGLTLCDVDDELRAAYAVPEHVHVLMWDVGPEADRLGIGRLERGFGLFHVGETQVTSVRDALEKLLAGPAGENDNQPGSKRVVYDFWNEKMHGTNTQYAHLRPEDREQLRQALERLPR